MRKDKMTDAEKLVMFMEKKTDALMSTGMERRSLYFNKKDKEALLDLTDIEANRAWTRIERTAGSLWGLFSDTCPYCLIYRDCTDCPYGKHHGICKELGEGGSDFQQVFHLFYNNLTSETYRQILREIEEDEKG